MVAGMLLLAHPAYADFQTTIDFSDKQYVEIPFNGGKIGFHLIGPKTGKRWPPGFSVKMPGYKSGKATIANNDLAWINYGQWVGITRLQKSDEAPSILFEAYTGGAHCCSVLVVLTPIGDKLQSIEFRSADGEVRGELPVDIDGDGIVDIVRENENVDNDDKYEKRTAIYNIRSGKKFDVTADPKFAAYLAARNEAAKEDEE
jgi:hypothetical protein